MQQPKSGELLKENKSRNFTSHCHNECKHRMTITKHKKLWIVILNVLSAGGSGVPSSLVIQPVVPALRRMVFAIPEPTAARLSLPQVSQQTYNVWSRSLRPYDYNERFGSYQMPEGRLGQAGLLPFILLLLSLRVRKLECWFLFQDLFSRMLINFFLLLFQNDQLPHPIKEQSTITIMISFY